jgi:dsDNA-binding SOS-regulon protein
MEKRILRLAVLAFLVLALTVPSLTLAQMKGPAVKPPSSVGLRQALRDLWIGHIFWVRNVVLTTKFGDKEAAKVAEDQVVQNAKDIANSITPYYGKEASDKLFSLLAGHYAAVKDYMNAVFTGNKEAKAIATDKMKKNADEIATFLSSANPKNWPKEALVSALMAHVGFHMAQIDEINAKNFSAEAKTWEGMKNQVNQIADVLAQGIANQFGSKNK